MSLQFLNGAIKRQQKENEREQNKDFNSLMVRLKVTKQIAENFTAVSFQFLNGAIKSMDLLDIYAISSLFQFLNGAIKRNSYNITMLIKSSFNSLMVRLKVGYLIKLKEI